MCAGRRCDRVAAQQAEQETALEMAEFTEEPPPRAPEGEGDGDGEDDDNNDNNEEVKTSNTAAKVRSLIKEACRPV